MEVYSRLNKWVVSIFCSICCAIAASSVECYHLFLEEIRSIYGVSYKQASLVTGFGLSLIYLSIFSHIFSQLFGYRKCVVFFGLITSLCQIGAAFANQFSIAVLLLGVANGLCSAATYNCPIIAAGMLFPQEQRSRAFAIIFIGPGFGRLLFPFIYQYFMSKYSYRGAVFILGAISLNIVVAGLALPHLIPEEPRNREKSPTIWKSWTSGLSGLLTMLRLDLLKDWRVHALNFASFVITCNFAVIYSFAFTILTKDYKLPPNHAVWLVGLGGASSLLGKFLVFFLKDSPRFPRWWKTSIICLSKGIAMTLFGALSTTGLPGAAVLYSLICTFVGFIYTLHTIVLSDLFHIHDFAMTYSYNMIFMLIGAISGPVLAGWLADVTHSFCMSLMVAGGIPAVVFSIPVFAHLIWLCRNSDFNPVPQPL